VPLGGIKSGFVKVCLRSHLKEWNVSDEWSESGREFQIVGEAVQKEHEPKIRLMRLVGGYRRKMT